MGSSVTAGSYVAMLVDCILNSWSVSSVTGLGGTWAKINRQTNTGGAAIEWWVGAGCTGGTAITPTCSGSYQAVAFEVDGAGASSDGGSANASSTSPSLTISGLAANDAIFVMAYNGSNGAFSSPPSSPWSTYTADWAVLGSGIGIAYQVTSGTSNQTATWTQANQQWGASGLIVGSPPPPASNPSFFSLF